MHRYWIVVGVSAVHMSAAVDFATEIHPIFSAKCMGCHSGASPQAKLSLGSRALTLTGGASGPAIVPGKPSESILLRRVMGDGGLPVMPPTGVALKDADIAKIRQWIEEGANWPDMAAVKANKWTPPLEPRRPPIPEAAANHPIDRFLQAYWAKNKITPPSPVNDRQYVRRVYYDIWGLPPTTEQVGQFEASQDPDKRQKLVKELLANGELSTGHWISFWNDMLRNDIGVVYHGDRKSITGWLQQSLKSNKPYREMLRELVNPIGKDSPDGFLVGVNWRGDINASQTPFMQASQNTAQIFLGINLKCASCHDSFINKYLLREAYGLAAFFTEQDQLELVRCDMKTGKMVKASFLYPELVSKPLGKTLAERRKSAAELFTHPKNGRTSRTIVNRYWQKLTGRGIVEPVDEMDNEPWNADLLDWIASDFDDHEQNLQYLIELITSSIAYQAQTSAPQTQGEYVFRGPSPRRISAEQFVDSVSTVTGEWRTLVNGAQAKYARDWQLKSSALTRSLGRPIRDQVYTNREDAATTFQALELANGGTLGKLLRRGARGLLAQQAPPPPNLVDTKPMRRGHFRFDIDTSTLKELWLLAEDAGSYDPDKSLVGMTDVLVEDKSGASKQLGEVFPEFKASNMLVNKEKLANGYVLPLGTSKILDLKGKGITRIQGWFSVDDSCLPSDIGTSARFFFFGTEPDRDQLIRVAGAPPIAAPASLAGKSPSEITRYLYRSLLSRDPNPVELEKASAIASGGVAGLEDLLWSLLLHPEFQYLP